MTDSGGYREKYRQALDDQERMERQFNAQMDYMRKTLFDLGSAAHGLDKQIDASLVNLRDKMRGAGAVHVIEQMEHVHRAVVQFERMRDQEHTSAAEKLAQLVDQLLELKVPDDLKSALKSFRGSLKAKLANYRSYPAVVEEFSDLQKLAFDAAANPEQSFWQRIKPGRIINKAEGEKKREDVAQAIIEGEIVPHDVHTSELELSPDKDLQQIQPEVKPRIMADKKQSITLEDDEESYIQVAERIADTLRELVEKIEPNEVIKHRVDMVRARIARGMDWYVLAVTLEDIRDILMQRYLEVDREFSSYLKRVNDELLSISEALGLAVSAEEKNTEAANKLSDCVSEQMEMMKDTVALSDTLEGLKRAVTDHLSAIHSALGDYQSSRKESLSLTDQLRTLLERVHVIESESKKTKELLEEERHKATHDTLTGLPNREAYNERAFHEYQRYKRYCRPLTLAVCDIDHFKKINDSFGHQAGDKVLKLIAKVVQTRLRKVDFIARYGGEEFVILLPETTASQAYKVLDKIRAAVGKTPFRFKSSPVQITISFGITEFEAEDAVEEAFERADNALYTAKKKGRNCCVIKSDKATK